MLEISKLEKRIRAYWAKTRAFEKSIENRKNARSFVFYEGPPTANGMPGIHHVLTRVFKDAICRYKTMQGYKVERKAGWDTHGLPVELEVEKELGLKNKRDIEHYGIAKFNARCRASVWKYKKNWEDLTRAIGFWLDMDRPYSTYDTVYTESVWWILKRVWEKKLLYQDYKVVPFCPRCETALSSHEVALGYKNIKESSIYVKFRIQNPKFKTKLTSKTKSSKSPKTHILTPNTHLVVWTTTPWTLPGNVAVAIRPDFDYVFVKQRGETLILAKERLGVLEGKYETLGTVRGKELLGLEYEPLFSFLPLEKKAHRVIVEDFVSLKEGTGLVHIAPAFGEEDMEAAKENDLPVLMTVNENGTFRNEVKPWAGIFVKDADPKITEHLKSRGLLYKEEPYAHDYPFCWRCDSPLLYYAKESWFIRMSALKGKLIASNKTINWVPSHLREGRFGEWLRELKDWALSRQRYWGTPLPLWICGECGSEEAAGSVGDLAIKAYSTNRFIILRHAEAESNVRGIISCLPNGDTFHLTPRGRRQAQEAAKVLARKKIDFIYTSDLIRTRETAEIVSKEINVPIRREPGLREYNLGIFNRKPIAEFEAAFPKAEEKFDRAPRGGETWNQVKTRMIHTVAKIDSRHTNKTILLVGHGDPLWIFEGALRGMSRDELLRSRELRYIEKAESRNVHYTRLPHTKDGEIDLHRPFIDEVTFTCAVCSGVMRRVPDLIDVWFDSGAMPFAQGYWPLADARGKLQTNKRAQKPKPPELFPADFICEAMDQTRGWFYTLLAISTLLGFGPPYKNVISVGWVLDKHGKKMSKSRGNIVNPWEIVETYGADALRWYFYTVNQPGEPKLFDEKDIREKLQRFILTYWNTLVFFETYVSKQRKSRFLNRGSPHVLDKWILMRLRDTKDFLTKHLDLYDLVGASRELETFLDDFSNWYLRRSRRRFQKPESRKDPEYAAETLGYVLFEFTKLSAPFVPFIAEAVYQRLSRYTPKGAQKESVHLEDWSRIEKTRIDKKLLGEMETVRRLASLGLKARREAGVKVRQPLRTLYVNNFDKLPRRELLEVLKDEINIKEVHGGERLPSGDGFRAVKEGGRELVLETRLTRELEEEGTIREIVRTLQDMRKDAGYKPTQRITVFYSGNENIHSLFKKWRDTLVFEAGAKDLLGRSPDHRVFDVERETVLGGENFWLGIKKN